MEQCTEQQLVKADTWTIRSMNKFQELVRNSEMVKTLTAIIEDRNVYFASASGKIIDSAKKIWSALELRMRKALEDVMKLTTIKSLFEFVTSNYERIIVKINENKNLKALVFPSIAKLFNHSKEAALYAVKYLKGELFWTLKPQPREMIEDNLPNPETDETCEDNESEICRCDEETNIYDLLTTSLSDYDSNQDSDFVYNSEEDIVSVDSLEYRSTENEDLEEPFTEEEKGAALKEITGEELNLMGLKVPEIIVYEPISPAKL